MDAPATPRSPVPQRLIAVSLIVMVVAAAFAYYEAVQSQSATMSSESIKSLQNTVNGLQSTVNSLELANQGLRAELTALSSQGNVSTGTNPVNIYATAKASVVTVQGTEVTVINTFFGPMESISAVLGSGFTVGYHGSSYIATNFHVVDGVSNLTVTFSDGNSYPATVVGSDAYSDIAVLSVNAPPGELVNLNLAGPGKGTAVGETVYAIGNPFGLSGSMTFGIVSQTGRTITESTTTQVSIPDIIQFSAPINPGNSGGPLLDSSGLVIGMTTASATNSQGLYFAIPSSTIIRELPSLVDNGTYTRHPYLGISGVDMSYQLSQATKTKVTYGVLVENVARGSPAASAGIRGGSSSVVLAGTSYRIGGDVIASINGAKVVNQDGLAAYLEENAVAGQAVTLGVVRSGAQINVTVVLGTIPGS